MDKEKKKKKNEPELLVPPTEEEIKQKKKKRRKILLIVSIIFLIIVIIYTKPFFLFGKKNKLQNEEHLKYLVDTYGETLRISFYTKKKKTWTYRICSKKTPFCTNAKYKKKWSYPKGESFIYAILFMDQAVDILDSHNINYSLYTDSKNTLTLPNDLILVIEKNDTGSLISAIYEMNRSNLISSLNKRNDKDGIFEIDIFSSSDYKIVTESLKENYNVDGYKDLYKILYDYDNNNWHVSLGSNIQRHSIADNMFDCTADNCGSYKHIAYRYVIGEHNYFGNSMILEGI